MVEHIADNSPDVNLERQALKAFEELCDLNAERRQAGLAQLPPNVAERVRALLSTDNPGGDDTFERGLDGPRSRVSEDLERASRPSQIAGYEILEELGRGGMGVVYRARQRHPERIVAIKVMRPGISSDEMLRRFEFEAIVLARLNHPGIASIIEAGTAHVVGVEVPFFAMELIEGQVLTPAVAKLGLSLHGRVQLLREIALAVHHAHLNGVVHRDLKPGNILVTREGKPKILDFGVARAVAPDDQLTTLNTAPGEIVGTLAYMSPEQVSGDPHAMDVRSDIYSLGAIAYELLSGSLPIDLRGKPLAEAARLIQDEDITPLSRAVRHETNRYLRGDLETIIGKALEKEKERRYSSAEAMAEDLRRYLEHEPIRATPPTAFYQLKKFSRRHRVGLGAVGVVFLTLVAALVNLGSSNRRVHAAERVAVSKGEVHAAVNLFIEDMFGSIDPSRVESTGFDTRVVDVLTVASEDASDSLVDHPEVEFALRRLFATTYSSLTDNTSAEREVDRALELCAELGIEGREHRECLHIKAKVMRATGRNEQAEVLFRQIVQQTLEESGPGSEEYCSHINSLSLVLKALGRMPEAKAMMDDARPALEASLGEENPEFLTMLHNLGIVTASVDSYPAGEAILTHVLEVRRRVEGPATMGTMSTQLMLGGLLNAMREYDRANELLREGVRIRHEVLGDDHMQTWDGESTFAWALAQRGECEEALTRSALALENIVRLQGLEGLNTLDIRTYHGRILRKCGQPAAAEPELQMVWEVYLSDPSKHHLAAKIAAMLAGARIEQEHHAASLEPMEWALGWALGQEQPDELQVAKYRLLYSKSLIGVDRDAEAREALLQCLAYLEANTKPNNVQRLEATKLLEGLEEGGEE